MSTHDIFDPVERPREDRKPPARPSGWHPINTGHLVMGVAFLGLFVVWAVLTSDLVELEDARWILPLPWLIAGAVGLLATVFRGRREPSEVKQYVQQVKDHARQQATHQYGQSDKSDKHFKGWH